ncbi:acyltransferase family protein [Actinoplanes derwentensis]|uniref:Peptidoglycan/LPS O-acetylase OafA/YrhL, contains acyltransferase and SGNH-hydrolase domains n=1 Tax=Actinoplanes derwentensis TaxID=113562 RepID=A0A1H2CAD5_9ACTN|nr:acyltransferase [Actinoplanes derwentensis]GID89035.1 membrane protein [Actinoplanes derwentensis]SDT67515.1 Peptidoglycan/LPS O-acetylase OafA/YrhL, contains acyltransferase and SGNH-hydrolase domains [Actinoplanes derwentensis]
MRNRYLDLLRAVATVRVVTYHVTGWTALTIVFPAMSVMFALGGSLMAASLDRFGVWAVERRLRRLLPSLWMIALIGVTTMLVTGTSSWSGRILLWGFPIDTPEATGWWIQGLSHAWYLRDFLWMVLLSPIVLPLYRRFPLATILTPYLALTVVTLAGFTVPAVLQGLALYGGAWLLGFAHHDGHLAGLGRRRLLGIAAALAVPAVLWTVTHPSLRGYDLNDIPLGNALWSAAFILIVLGWVRPPRVSENRLLTVLNARALTIYLWHVPVVVAVTQFAERHALPLTGWVGVTWRLTVVFVLVGAMTALFGWIEDMAAGRRPVLVPGRRIAMPVSPAPAGAASLSPASVSLSAAPVAADSGSEARAR